MNIASYFYNRSLLNRGGKVDVVANIKNVPAHLVKAVVADYERGLTNEITRMSGSRKPASETGTMIGSL